MMSMTAIFGAFESGMIYAILALGVFLSFRTLNTPDLTVDGSVVTGAAASAMICAAGGHPIFALMASFVVGCAAGAVTALLNIKLKIQPLLAGILVMLGLYSINLRIMGGRPNISLMNNKTIYTGAESVLPESYLYLIVNVIILIFLIALFYFFLNTRLGFALRATGDNEDMVRAAGIDSNAMKLLGLSLSNGFVGLAGGMLAQYQGFSDVTMGTGMVVIGLASVILGEALFGIRSLARRLVAVSLGAILYRFAIALALHLGMPAGDLKLVSAGIVTVALAFGLLNESISVGIWIKKRRKANA